ncbi:DNA-binding protein [Microbacterium murale]|uniref:DNA-binding protein n=1 Tax=Microbacterium murale TaxID=1081040 RepID=A0ABQ1S6F4_9MICO|nr:DNA-binding protein [Microbacterium murale]
MFTPKTIVTREMFARRNEPDLEGNPGLQDTLQDALRERGGQILLYGDTGVGKSSLLKYAAEDEGLGTVVVECVSSMSHADILDALVRKVVQVKKIAMRKSGSVEASATAEGKVPWFAKLSGTIKATGGVQSDYEIVEKDAIDVLAEVLPRVGRTVIVLDNFQNIKLLETRELVAQTLEQLSDRAADSDGGDVKAVVIGIAEDAHSLLGASRSYGRRTTEIGVPRMPDDELREVLTRGFKKLSIVADGPIVDSFVFYSDGFPYFAHLLGLNVARTVLKTKSEIISDHDLAAALKRSATAVTSTYAERTRKAREAGGEVQPRLQIMRMLAASEKRVWSSADVQTMWAEKIGPRDEYTFMHTALAQLSTAKHGSILRRTGARKHYLYQFEDPHMRPYLRIAEDIAL